MGNNQKALEQYNMYIPTYLKNYISNIQEKRLMELSISSSSGSEFFEVWYYGDLFEVEGEQKPYISDSDIAPEKIVLKDITTGEEILIHDSALHGYDNMFCDAYDTNILKKRTLEKYPIPASKIIIELGYSIDYEDEKDEYKIDTKGYTSLIDGRLMSWEDVKRNGFDYIALYYLNKNGDLVQFYDRELA